MPNLALYHPQVVHFVIALLFVGLVMRLISLTGRLRFTNHAAATLLFLGTLAAVLAVKSGDDAHGPVERIPGARAAVVEHEELAKRARNIFLGVAVIELLALGLAARPATARFTRWAHVGSVLVGIWGAFVLQYAATHGGDIVYSYAGGPGIRSGESRDVERLLLSGLYQQAAEDRRSGRREDAARLTEEMGRRFSADTTVRFLVAESLLLDRADASAALVALDAIGLDPANARLQTRRAMLRADIFLAMMRPDSARAVLTAAVASYPTNLRLKAKLDSIP